MMHFSKAQNATKLSISNIQSCFENNFVVLCKLVTLWIGWLGSRVVSALDSGTEEPGFKSQPQRSGNNSRQTVHTHRASSVHQAAKLVSALLRVAGVTAGLAESNGSLPPSL